MPDTPDPQDTEPRVTRQVRMSPDLWDAFTAATGEQQASGTLRRLMVMYLTLSTIRARVARIVDPCPDRRYAGKS